MSTDPLWNKPEEEPSYLWEMLTHQNTLYGFLSSLAAGSVLAIPYHLGVAALPLLGFVGATSLAALFVPTNPTFRNRVNRRRHAERRNATRAHLLNELSARLGPEHPNFQVYARMVQRVASLRTLARSHKSALTVDDVERLEDASVDYLGLWLARLAMAERRARLVSQNLEHKIRETQERLGKASGVERRPLEKALEELDRLLRSRKRIEAHETAVDAALIAMPDAFDEVYQGVMQNPTSSESVDRLKQAVDRMRIEDELSAAVDEDLEGLLKPGASDANRQAAAKARRQSA